MSAIEQAAPSKRGPSLLIQIAVLVMLTLVALAMGWGAGRFVLSPRPGAQGQSEAGGTAQKKAEKSAPQKPGVEGTVVPLDAIITNLAAPSTVWVRIGLSIVFDGPPDQAVAQAIHQDILAYMRTVKLPEIQGASGFQHLREDLEERAAVRSGGRVKKILINTLLFE